MLPPMRERMENHAPVATPQSAAAAHTPWRRRALGLTLKSQKNCAFFTADFSTGQPRQAPATESCQHRRRLASALQRRRGGEGGGLENLSCATAPFYGGVCAAAPPSGTTFLCLFDAMENQPSSGRWKNGAKNTIFKEREETLFCSLTRAISNSYGGRFNKNLSRKSQRKLALAMMDRIVRKFCLV